MLQRRVVVFSSDSEMKSSASKPSRAAKASRALKETLFSRFFGNVSIPMAHFILPQNNMLVRALTASAIALAIGATLFQMYDRIHYYCAHPLVAVVTETDQDNQTMPAIIVCPGGQFRPSQAYHRFGTFDSFYRGSMDMKHIEEHRCEIIANMRKQNITITSESIAYLELELGRISAILNNKIKRGVTIDLSASWWKEILTSLSNLTETFQNIFPIMMSKLSAKEPFAFRKLPLNITGWYNSHQAFEIAKAFELFRHENMLSKLDVCTDSFLLSDNRTWAALFPEILQCRLGDVNTEPSILRDVHHIQLYPVVVNFLRTASKDLILNCKWMGNACAITDVWTALGKCFRVGPQDESGAFVDRVGDDVSSVNILIDTLNNEFSNKQSKIYFYPQNETEFAQITGGIAVKSGMVSHVAINQIRKSIRDPKNCGTRELLKFKRYTKEKCVWEQKTNPIAAKCGCISDLAPDYFSYATEEMPKMTTAEIYLNETNKFCSLGENLICAPNSIATAYDCPNNCVEVKYEVDMITGHIDDKLIFSRLPLGFDENQVNSLEKLSEYGTFQTAPGYDQLNVVLEQLFEYHLRMMEMFWWKKDENPYYPTWFNNRADYGYGTRGSYFGRPPYVTSSIMPCFEDSFNPALFDINPARLSLLITILEKYKSRYDFLNGNWTKSYKREVYQPFKREIKHAIKRFRNCANKTDSSLIEMTVLKKIYKQMILFHVCFGHAKCEYLEWRIERASVYHYMLELEVYTDPSLSELWAPRWMLELEEVLNEGLSFSNTTKKMVNDLIGTKGSRNSSVWSKPLAIYLAWFMKDPLDENGEPDRYMPTIPHAFSLEAYKLDVYTVARSYGRDSLLREQLRRALIDTSYAIKNSSMVLKLVGLRLLRIVRAHKSAIFYEEVAKHAAFYEPLFHETEHAAINKTMLCLDHYYRVLDYRGTNEYNHVFTLSADGSSTIWFSRFTDLVDNNLRDYSSGTGYHEASLSEINVFFRSFGQRTIEERMEYTIGSLLSDIGGALGLWIGATVISIFELVLLCISPRFLKRRPLHKRIVRTADQEETPLDNSKCTCCQHCKISQENVQEQSVCQVMKKL